MSLKSSNQNEHVNELHVNVKRHTLPIFAAFALGLALLPGTGCKSKQDAAVDEAKKQAAATGQPQQVVSTDSSGTTTTTTVQPPAPGQPSQQVTQSTASTANGAARPQVANGGAPVVQPAPGAQPGVPGAQPTVPERTVASPATGTIALPNVHVAAGTTLAIRLNEGINVKHVHTGDRFTGEIAEGVTGSNGDELLPKGTPVNGRIDEAHKRGHFKGRSILELRLTSLTLNGVKYPVATHDISETKKGKGKRSTALIGGGTGLGLLIGGVATGGVGLLVGGAIGAATGTGIAGLTGNKDIILPAESVVRFKLADDLDLRQP